MKQTTISFTQAKAHLSEYGRRAQSGQTTLVLNHRRPTFVIAPVPRAVQARPKVPGLAKGQIRLAADFSVTPAEVIEAFEGTR